jgi:hypothetical protein
MIPYARARGIGRRAWREKPELGQLSGRRRHGRIRPEFAARRDYAVWSCIRGGAVSVDKRGAVWGCIQNRVMVYAEPRLPCSPHERVKQVPRTDAGECPSGTHARPRSSLTFVIDSEEARRTGAAFQMMCQ